MTQCAGPRPCSLLDEESDETQLRSGCSTSRLLSFVIQPNTQRNGDEMEIGMIGLGAMARRWQETWLPLDTL